MRTIYFLIFIAILTILNAGFIYFSQHFFKIYENYFLTEDQINLLAFQPIRNEKDVRLLEKNPATLLFVGDIMLSRGVANQIKKHKDPAFPFLKIADFLKKADLTFGNLEGPISSRGENQGSAYSFRANPEVIKGLTLASFDVLSLANNHIFDYGKEALLDTISLLKENNIETIGVGKNYSEANPPLIKEINNSAGFPQAKIAFLAYTDLYPQSLKAKENSTGVSDFNIEKIKNIIEQTKKSRIADIIAISLHWGEEYQTHSNYYQQKIARSLIDSGADLIVGHHPHVAQEIENYRDSWIAYSLGNFIFDQNFSEETMSGLALKVVVKNKKIDEIVPIKIKINNAFQPEINAL